MLFGINTSLQSHTLVMFLETAYFSKFHFSQQLQNKYSRALCRCSSLHVCTGRRRIFHLRYVSAASK